MGTTKRRKRNQRSVAGESEILMLGVDIFHPGRLVFESVPAMRAAWERRRNELMANHAPGDRPYAFFRFDLGLNPAPVWWEQEIAALLDHHLINAEEAFAIEARHQELGCHSVDFCSSFDSIERHQASGGARNCAPDARMVSQFRLAARWHEWRGRTELAALWGKRVGVAQLLFDVIKNVSNRGHAHGPEHGLLNEMRRDLMCPGAEKE